MSHPDTVATAFHQPDDYKPALTVVVPVYNNASSIPELNKRLLSTLDSMGPAYEIIYVNDRSTDTSNEVLTDLHTTGSRIKVVDLERNFGQSSAVLAGFSIAAGDIIITIDADLENHPEDIPALVEAIHNGANLVCGVRGNRQAALLTRRGPSRIANWLVGHALSIELKDWGCGLNAVTASIVKQILSQDPLPMLPKIEAALLSSCISQVPVAYSKREHGQSGYTVRRLASFATSFLRGYSITRTFQRLAGVPIISGSSTMIDSGGASPTFAARSTRTAVALIAWIILATAAVTVRFGLFLSGSNAKAERYQIRKILR